MSIFKKTGKIASILSAAALFLTSMAIPAAADTVVVDGEMDDTTGLVYKATEDGTGWIVSSIFERPLEGDIVIPETWTNKAGDVKNVVKMGSDLDYWGKVTSVSIPKTVTDIDKFTFRNHGTSILKTITVAPDNPNFTVVDGVLYNKDKTELILYPPKKSGTSFTVPATVKVIKQAAFFFVDELTSITISEGVTTMGSLAVNCKKIDTVSIPASVTTFGEDDHISGVTTSKYDIDENNPNYCSVDGVAFSKDKTVLIDYPSNLTATSYTIPNTVKEIVSNALRGGNLKEFTIPASVTKIGASVFSGVKIIHSDNTVEYETIKFNYQGTVEQWKAITIDRNNEVIDYNGVTCSDGVINGTGTSNDDTDIDNKTIVIYDDKTGKTFDETWGPWENTILFGDKYTTDDMKAGDVIAVTAVATADASKLEWGAQAVFKYHNTTGSTIDGSDWSTIHAFKADTTSKEIKYTLTESDIKNLKDVHSDKAIMMNGGGITITKVTITRATASGDNTVVQKPSSKPTENGKATEYTPKVEANSLFTTNTMDNVKAVRVEAPAGAFSDTVNLVVEPKSESGRQFAVDISFVNGSGQKVQPAAGKPVTVKIPVPESMQSASEIFVYHTDDSGKMTKVEAAIETVDGKKYVVFTASSFSVYTLSSTAVAEAEDSNNSNSNVPNIRPVAPETASQTAAPETAAQSAAETSAAADATAAADNAGSDDKNQATGAAIAVIPAILAAAAVAISKKNK